MDSISKEVLKYPYCGQKEEKHTFLSEKVVDFVVLKSGQTVYIIYETTGPVIYTFKDKSKTIISIVVFVIAVQFSFPERADSVPLRVPARPFHERVQSSPYHEVKSAPLIQQKPDKIKFNFVASREAFPLIYINSKIYLTDDVINKIRGGWQWNGSKNVVLDVFFICVLAYAITNVDVADAFVNQVFAQLSQLNAPTSAPYSPYFGGSGPTFRQPSLVIHRCENFGEYEVPLTAQELGQVTCSQSKTFVKTDGSINTEQGHQEVLRRAEGSINPENFNCSKERFVALSTENGQMTQKKIQEAISVLQLEANGVISNVRRDPVAANNRQSALDFLAEDKNGDTIHIEVKGPVGSAIKLVENGDPSVAAQGKSIGEKLPDQIAKWIRSDKITPIESPLKVLVVVDLFDVPMSEKAPMQAAIDSGLEQGVREAGSLKPMITFINNVRNR